MFDISIHQLPKNKFNKRAIFYFFKAQRNFRVRKSWFSQNFMEFSTFEYIFFHFSFSFIKPFAPESLKINSCGPSRATLKRNYNYDQIKALFFASEWEHYSGSCWQHYEGLLSKDVAKAMKLLTQALLCTSLPFLFKYLQFYSEVQKKDTSG